MRKFILLSLLFQTFLFEASSIGLADRKWGEELEKPSPWFYGLGFGVNFFPDGIIGQSTGMVAYRIKKRTFIGLNPSISDLFQRLEAYNPVVQRIETYHYQSAYYDLSLYFRNFFYKRYFVQIEPGGVNYKDLEGIYFDVNSNKIKEQSKRFTVPYVLAGVGFLAPIGDKSFFVMRVQYDILGRENSPYKGYPVIRGGINFSF